MSISPTTHALSALVALNLLTSVAFADPTPQLPKGALPLPLIAQATSYSCGAAALLSVLYYFKVYSGNENQLYKPLRTTPKSGTDPNAIAKFAQTLGLEVDIKTAMTIENLRERLAEGTPVILDIQAWQDVPAGQPLKDWKDRWDDGHYVVLTAMDADFAYFMDPSAHVGYGYMPIPELLDRWHDYEIIRGRIQKYEHLGIAIRGTQSHQSFPSSLIRME